MVFADCETLAAVPVVKAWEPLVEMVPPPSSISLAPATVELVEIDRVAVGHNQAVKDDGHPPLLAESRRPDLLCFAKDDRSFWDDDVLAVVRIQGIRDKDLDGAGGVAVQAIHQHCVEDRALVYEIGLANR